MMSPEENLKESKPKDLALWNGVVRRHLLCPLPWLCSYLGANKDFRKGGLG